MYSWSPMQVLSLMGINANVRGSEIKFPCPVCGGKNFSFNINKGLGHCFSAGCGFSCNSRQLYATYNNVSLTEAGRMIEKALGITPDRRDVPRPQRIVYQKTVEEEEIAPDEVLDDTYRAFLNELGLSQKNQDNLLSRGFTLDEIEARGYKTFPGKSEVDYIGLCRRLLADGHTLKGVPGFYPLLSHTNDYSFVQLTKGIIMPCINIKNQIIGLQVRKDDDLRVYNGDRGEYEPKCAWFSSKNLKGGTGAKARIHYSCDFVYDKEKRMYKPVLGKGIMLTEGFMKADLVHQIKPNLPVIAVPGVNATTQLLLEAAKLKELGVEKVLLAYDMDYKTNPNVQEALGRTKAILQEAGLSVKQSEWTSSITVKGEFYNLKGIDDYLAYTAYQILPTVKKSEK